jgi:hypothetical protein
MKKTMAALTALVMVVGASQAAITTTYHDMGNLSSTVQAQTNTLTVAAGDVVVLVAPSNKKSSVNGVNLTTTAAGTVIDLGADAQLGNDPNPDSHLSYIVIGTAGTYDFIGSSDVLGITANLGLYQLSADSGLIELAGNNAKRYANLAVGDSLSVTNFMSWGSNPNAPNYDGIVTIGVGSSLRGTIVNTNSVGGFTLDEDNSGKRLAGWSDRTGNNNVKHIWDITNADATRTESGGITGAAFAEVIPEPATIGLFAAAGLMVWYSRRKFTS